ncbi:MAG: apolipoprotein N-acyltransferase [Candidatus Neomarinimicrobiota bacterium]
MIFLDRPSWQLAILSGVLVGISYLPLKLGFCIYFGFIPIFHSWISNDSKSNLISGLVFGVTYNLISNYWIGTNSGAEFYVVILSLIFAVFYLSLFWAFAGLVYGLIRTSRNTHLILPFLIVVLEWVRSFGPLGFTWGNLALTQSEYLVMLQLLDFTGTYLVTFIIISINLFLYLFATGNKFLKVNFRLIIFTLIIIPIFGFYRMKNISSTNENINIAIIQPNIDPNKKWDYNLRKQTMAIMDSLYKDAITMNPDLIIFPETALPSYLRIENRVRKRLQQKVNESGIPIIIGTVDRHIDSNRTKSYFNSSMYLSPKADYLMYDKIHLVPFAEYDLIPSFLSPLANLNLNMNRGIFKKGNNYVNFRVNDLVFSDLICYESSFPRYARKFVGNGADFLIIQANDGWLGTSAGPFQHFAQAKLRAIENRTPIARGGNTGISGFILPTGEVMTKTLLGKQVIIKEKLPIYNSGTFYTFYGDVFAAISFVIFLFIGPVNCLKK